MWVSVCPSLDDVFLSFARCIRVSELVGINKVEQYFPNRVTSQFGMLQDVPCPANQKKLSQEAAWNDYSKPVDDLTLYIPSRCALPCVTPTFCEWWRKSFPGFKFSSEENMVVESAETFKERTIIGDDDSFFPSGSMMNRTSEDGMKKYEDSINKRVKYIKQACDKRRSYMKQAHGNGKNESAEPLKSSNIIGDNTSFVISGSKMNKTSKDAMKIAEVFNKRRKYMKRARENDEITMGHCHTQVPSDNDEVDGRLTIAQMVGPSKKKYSDVKKSRRDTSEPLDKKCRVEVDNNDSGPCQKLASISYNGNESVPPSEVEKKNEATDETGSKAGKNVVSQPETRKTCDGELDVSESNADMINDGRKQPKCLLHEDGIIAGEKASSDENLCSSKAEKEDDVDDDDSLMNNNNSVPHQQPSSGGTNGDETSRAYESGVLSPSDESNIHFSVGEGSKGHDCLLHDNGLGSAETMKSNEQLENLEKRNNDFGEGDACNDSYGKRFQELKVQALSIKERIIKAQKTVAWLKERTAT
ncbi:unnamed protein product [Arabidopsis halleri]